MTAPAEIWRAVPRIQCEVSNLGRIRNLCTGRVRKPSPHKNGYLQIVLRRDGRMRAYYIHRLVCEAFHGHAPDGLECHHLNSRRDDNRPENLAWVRPSENKACRSFASGGTNGQAKLTEDDVRAIRALLPATTNRAIADLFGVRERTISDIRRGVTWNEHAI